jgi:uncharacterized protein (TIGR03503 family)
MWSIPSYSSVNDTKTLATIEYYKDDNITNQIPYFDNRFRIDAQIEELTLIFYREAGSKPIILVQPDGSKLKSKSIDKDQVEWFDETTFDMIRIKKPMPGPWQAVGRILPNSKIMVMSDVKIEVDPLPPILFAGETLKVTGQLFNGDKAIDNPLFRDVIELDVNFYSTNNSAYENFGVDEIKVSSFRDDGYDLDEYSGDNIFTGEFVFDFVPGEWQPVIFVKLPMATRELRQSPIILKKTPIILSVDMSESEGQFHQINFSIDKAFIDADTLAFQGKVRYPNKQFKSFSIQEGQGDKETLPIEYTEPGIYNVSVSAFGETINGREFRLAVEPFSFNVKVPEANDFVDDNGRAVNELIKQRAEALLASKRLEAKRLFKEKEELKLKETVFTIVVANVFIIFIVLMGFFIIRWRKSVAEK